MIGFLQNKPLLFINIYFSMDILYHPLVTIGAIFIDLRFAFQENELVWFDVILLINNFVPVVNYWSIKKFKATLEAFWLNFLAIFEFKIFWN
jgi:hypothetical protein